jgi:hypothetical protein|uniref:Uncharacterized protein n=2 Tax=Oryza TaxID=4527 RepID=A0A0E0PTA8_ORYRU
MAEELKQLNYSLQDADQSIIVQTMTVAESRRSRRLKTSPNVGGRPPRRLRSQATTSMIRCSSCTSLTILLTGATSSVNGSNQMPTSKISMIDRSIGFSLSSSSSDPVSSWILAFLLAMIMMNSNSNKNLQFC